MYPVKRDKEATHRKRWKVCLYQFCRQFCRALQFVLVMLRKTARLTMPEPKDRLTIRVDHDVVQWLKKNGRGYQTRINAILRSYTEAQSTSDH